MSLSLALGHFLSIPILYVMAEQQAVASFANPALVTFTGCLLLAIAFLCRFAWILPWLPYGCLMVLFVQASIAVMHNGVSEHPLTMAFPLLTALAAPILGRYRSYLLAVLSSAVLLARAGLAREPWSAQVGALMLVLIVVGVSAYLAETLWGQIRSREDRLRSALVQLEAQALEMERWARQLAEASSRISAGQLSASLPEPLPHEVYRDLTRGVELMQAQLRKFFTDRILAQNLNSIGVMASGVAHELNTPLTSMLFILDTETTIPSNVRDRVRAEVEHMHSIVKGLLEISRPRREGAMGLNQAVERGRQLMGGLRRRSVEVRFESSPDEILVDASEGQIVQMLTNLVQNAVDAIENTASPEVVVTTSVRGGEWAVLEVADNGSGMDEQTLVRALDPFFTTKSPGRGTGLGLFIVHQLARACGAELAIESARGKGTRVRVTFPIARRATQGRAA